MSGGCLCDRQPVVIAVGGHPPGRLRYKRAGRNDRAGQALADPVALAGNRDGKRFEMGQGGRLTGCTARISGHRPGNLKRPTETRTRNHPDRPGHDSGRLLTLTGSACPCGIRSTRPRRACVLGSAGLRVIGSGAAGRKSSAYASYHCSVDATVGAADEAVAETSWVAHRAARLTDSERGRNRPAGWMGGPGSVAGRLARAGRFAVCGLPLPD